MTASESNRASTSSAPPSLAEKAVQAMGQIIILRARVTDDAVREELGRMQDASRAAIEALMDAKDNDLPDALRTNAEFDRRFVRTTEVVGAALRGYLQPPVQQSRQSGEWDLTSAFRAP